jgi:hypothetical protein
MESTTVLGQPQGYPQIDSYTLNSGIINNVLDFKKAFGLYSQMDCVKNTCFAIGGTGNLNAAKGLLANESSGKWKEKSFNFSQLIAIFGIWCSSQRSCLIAGESSPTSGNSQAIIISA